MDRESERRFGELVKFGVVSDVNHKAGLCRLSLGGRPSPWSPWLMGRCGKDKEYWHPDIGEQGVFISPYGDGSAGFVMIGIMSDKIPLPAEADEDRHVVEYGDGARILVDRRMHVIDILDHYGSNILMHDGFIDLLPVKRVRIRRGGK